MYILNIHAELGIVSSFVVAVTRASYLNSIIGDLQSDSGHGSMCGHGSMFHTLLTMLKIT